MSKIYPVDHTNDELKARAAELSERIVKYDPKNGNAEHLFKDTVLFNTTYIELQNRAANRASGHMVLLTWASAVVAAASLGVAWLSYKATQSGDEWQSKQLKLLTAISEQTKPVLVPTALAASGVPSTVPSTKSTAK